VCTLSAKMPSDRRWIEDRRVAGLFALTTAFMSCDEAPDQFPVSAGEISPGVIDEATLIEEVADVGALSDPQRSQFRTLLASSYDRASRSPAQPGWFSNDDATGSQAIEGEERVLLDVDGPGALVHFWSARPQGRFRVFIDGAATPAIDQDFGDFLAHGPGRPGPPFVTEGALRLNVFYPVPFARHVRVTVTPSPDYLFHQIEYRRYDADAAVRSYGDPAVSRQRIDQALVRARAALATARSDGEAFERVLRADGADALTVDAAGGAEITSLSFHVEGPGSLDRTVVTASFDGVQTVEAPLGLLFATEPGSRPVASVAMTSDGERNFTLLLPMPFRRSARIALRDRGGGVAGARVRALVRRRTVAPSTMYLHARWTGRTLFTAPLPRDWHLASVRGSGVYVGTVLRVLNSSRGWWGEGDHRFWVDDESFPSQHGTGTEDYFGYAWCSTERFSTPFLGQTLASPADFSGSTIDYRFHVIDRVPFHRSFRFDLEVWTWEFSARFLYEAVYFFYGGDDARPDPPAADPHDDLFDQIPRVAPLGDGWTRC